MKLPLVSAHFIMLKRSRGIILESINSLHFIRRFAKTFGCLGFCPVLSIFSNIFKADKLPLHYWIESST